MDCTLWILLSPLILVVEICDAVCIKSCLICDETKNGLVVCWTNRWQKFSRFGLRADVRPACILNWKRKAVLYIIPSNRAYDHRENLLSIFSCSHLGPRQHVLRHAPLDQVYERLSVFLHTEKRCSFSVLCKSTIHYNKFVWFGCFKSGKVTSQDIVSGRTCKRYSLKFYTRHLQLIIHDIRCSAFPPASACSSARTQSVSVVKTNHDNRSLM